MIDIAVSKNVSVESIEDKKTSRYPVAGGVVCLVLWGFLDYKTLLNISLS